MRQRSYDAPCEKRAGSSMKRGMPLPPAGSTLRPAAEKRSTSLARIQRNVDDPGALLGIAKDLLESTSKFVLEERGMLPNRRLDFDEGLHLALDQLALLPTSVDANRPGGKQLRAIYQSAKTTASTTNELRNLQGAGHGRTLPTGVSPETGRYVIREAAHVAELMLGTHDRQMGRRD